MMVSKEDLSLVTSAAAKENIFERIANPLAFVQVFPQPAPGSPCPC
jgi:hypothetical protein